MTRTVTEQDLRAPEFMDGSPEDYEFRADGKIVRKDRWERGIGSIVSILGWSRREYEISEVVEQVRTFAEAREAADETNFCQLIDELIGSWNTNAEDSEELRQRRIKARQALEDAIDRCFPADSATE